MRKIHERLRQAKIAQLLGNPELAPKVKDEIVASSTRKQITSPLAAAKEIVGRNSSFDPAVLDSGASRQYRSQIDNSFKSSPAKAVAVNRHAVENSNNYQLSIEEMFKDK